MASEAESITPFSYYKENIFSEEDFYLYRAIMLFYAGEYSKARKDFELSMVKKEENKDENENSDTESDTSNQTDLSDVGLCSLNVHESKYNQALWYLMMEEHEEALKIFNELINNGPEKYARPLYLIRGLIYQQLGDNQKSKLDFNKSFDEDNETAIKYFEERQNVTINPFPISNRLWMHFSTVKVLIDKKNPPIYTRPSFSFPFIKPPNMIPNVDEKVLSKEFDIAEFHLNKPEAPWIKRWEHGIKFTNEVQHFDFKIDDSKLPKHENVHEKAKEVEHAAKMPASVSEQVIKQNYNFFDDDSEINL